MKNNTFFDELNRNACAWERKHEAHNALKQQIIEEKGWDSEELNGHIVQHGTHQELIAKDGIYKSFVEGRQEAAFWKIA